MNDVLMVWDGTVFERLEGLDHLFDRDEKHGLDQMYAFIKEKFA